MCLGGSSPTVYKRPNPQDIYYNGNIYDPKPKKPEPKKVRGKGGELYLANDKGKPTGEPLLYKSSTGLNI